VTWWPRLASSSPASITPILTLLGTPAPSQGYPHPPLTWSTWGARPSSGRPRWGWRAAAGSVAASSAWWPGLGSPGSAVSMWSSDSLSPAAAAVPSHRTHRLRKSQFSTSLSFSSKKICTAHARDFVTLSVRGSLYRSSEIIINKNLSLIAISIFSFLGVEFYNENKSSADYCAQCV